MKRIVHGLGLALIVLQQAVETFRQSLTANPLNSETYLNLGAAHLRLGNLNVALEMTEKALVIVDQEARHYAQLEDIDIIHKNRLASWNYYFERFREFLPANGVTLPSIPDYAAHNGHISNHKWACAACHHIHIEQTEFVCLKIDVAECVLAQAVPPCAAVEDLIV